MYLFYFDETTINNCNDTVYDYEFLQNNFKYNKSHSLYQ